jgi:hypothetical protein
MGSSGSTNSSFISKGRKRKKSGKERVSQFYPEDGDKIFFL